MVKEVFLSTSRVEVEFIKSWIAGKCYTKMQYLVRSDGALSVQEIEELCRGGFIGYGHELQVDVLDNGETLITRGVDSSD